MRNTSASVEGHRARSSDTIEIFETVRMLRRHQLTILASLVVFVAAGIAYLSSAIPVHMATVRLLVERHDVALDKRTQLRYEPAFIETQAEIVRSRGVVEGALSRAIPPTIAAAEDPVAAAMSAIRVTPVEGTYVMQISYRSTDSAEAVAALESLVESYREYLRDSEKDTQLQTLTFLTENEQDLRSQLEEKEAAYRELRSRSALLGVGQDAGRVQAEYITNLGRALTEAKSRRMQLQNQVTVWKKSPLLANSEKPLREIGVVQASFSNGVAPVNATPTNQSMRYGDTFALPKTQKLDHVAEIRALQEQLGAAQTREQGLDSVYGDSHPDLREVRSQIEAKQLQLKEMVAAIPRVFEDELDAVRMHESELEELYNSELKKAKQLDVHELEEQQLLASVERLRGVHDSILTEMRSRQTASASAESGHGIVHVKTIAAAKSTGSAVWPIPAVVLAVCGVVGLCAGVTLALLIENFTRYARRKRLADSEMFDSDDGFMIVENAKEEGRRRVVHAH